MYYVARGRILSQSVGVMRHSTEFVCAKIQDRLPKAVMLGDNIQQKDARLGVVCVARINRMQSNIQGGGRKFQGGGRKFL